MTDYLTDVQNDIEVYFKSHKLPNYFYQCFFGELVKMFGTSLIAPDPSYLAEYDDEGNIIPGNEKDYSYKDQLAYFLTCFGGTSGWYKAFKESCAQCKLMQLYQDYQNMDWVRSDIFDGYIADRTLAAMFAGNKKAYYIYKVEGDNE